MLKFLYPELQYNEVEVIIEKYKNEALIGLEQFVKSNSSLTNAAKKRKSSESHIEAEINENKTSVVYQEHGSEQSQTSSKGLLGKPSIGAGSARFQTEQQSFQLNSVDNNISEMKTPEIKQSSPDSISAISQRNKRNIRLPANANDLYCQTCEVTVSSIKNMTDHIHGKKHRKRENMINHRKGEEVNQIRPDAKRMKTTMQQQHANRPVVYQYQGLASSGQMEIPKNRSNFL